MTELLAEKTCTPCRGGIPPLTIEEARRYHEQAPSWTLPVEAGQIERKFWFSNFREALGFAHAVGELAEAEQHHPDVAFGWGYATIALRTKKIKGLHQNDFIMAVKIDRLAREHGALDNPARQRRSPVSEAATATNAPNDNRRSMSADHSQ
jgi:4a-hydroxytetrahydrobiopterin dehydratase